MEQVQHQQENHGHATEERVVDNSFNILMLAFNAIITALFALIGLAVYSWSGFMFGGLIGIVVGTVLFISMTRG